MGLLIVVPIAHYEGNFLTAHFTYSHVWQRRPWCKGREEVSATQAKYQRTHSHYVYVVFKKKNKTDY